MKYKKGIIAALALIGSAHSIRIYGDDLDAGDASIYA